MAQGHGKGKRLTILIQQEILTEIERLNSLGVPLLKLHRDYNLQCSRVHLRKLIGCLAIANNSISEGKPLSPTVKDMIYSSLFPAWLDAVDSDEVRQPPQWYYEGTMPFGKWINRKEKGTNL